MGSIKSEKEKQKIIVEKRKAKRLPAFVTVRTKRRIRDKPGRRNWRKRKIKMKTLLGTHSIKSRRKNKR